MLLQKSPELADLDGASQVTPADLIEAASQVHSSPPIGSASPGSGDDATESKENPRTVPLMATPASRRSIPDEASWSDVASLARDFGDLVVDDFNIPEFGDSVQCPHSETRNNRLTWNLSACYTRRVDALNTDSETGMV